MLNITDPELSLPSILVIGKILDGRKTVVYVVLVTIFSTLAGSVFSWDLSLIPEEVEYMEKAKTQQEPCPCMRDPFATLPPGLRPRPVKKESSLRKVSCPSCGKVYWTNREVDICFDCEKGIVNSVG